MQLLRFVAAMTAGLAIDAVMLPLLLQMQAGPLAGRLPGFLLGIAATLLIGKGRRCRIVLAISGAVGGALYAALIIASPQIQPLAALGLAALAALVFSLLGYRRFVLGD